MRRPTLPGLLERHLAERPQALAFVADNRPFTYAQFDTLVRRTSAWLVASGVGPGDRVAVWLVNRIEWLALLFALARIGAALMSVNTRFRAAELEQILERSGARLLVLQLNFRSIDFPAVLAGVDPARVSALERIAVVDAGTELPAQVLGRPTIAFDAFASDATDDQDRSDPDALAILFTTSGTTRGPKLVMHTQRTIVVHSRSVALALGLDENDARLLAALPFCGVFGLNGALAAFAAGAPVVIMDTFDGTAAAALVRQHAVTHMFGSDEMYRRMFEAVPGEHPFPSARLFGYAAFQPRGAEFARAGWELGVPLMGLYGSSEVQALFSVQRRAAPLEQRIEGGGAPASQEAEVRIRDLESGALLPPGRSGEIEIRAPGNFIGYLNDAPATAAALGSDGFFRTGDIGRLREDGSFVYETRRGDAIRLAGFLVNPAEIEDTLKGIAGISDVAVIAVELSGQMRCVAFVVSAADTAITEAAVQAAAAGLMAGFKVPARVWFVDALPVIASANGVKVQRARLREMALERLASTPPMQT